MGVLCEQGKDSSLVKIVPQLPGCDRLCPVRREVGKPPPALLDGHALPQQKGRKLVKAGSLGKCLPYRPAQLRLVRFKLGGLGRLSCGFSGGVLFIKGKLPFLCRPVCTSSSKFQDNLFDDNAIPPTIIEVLGRENREKNGAVEAYIYRLFSNKHSQLEEALNYCLNATKEDFMVKHFIDSFWNEPGLKRSLDKIYEIIVYALFSTLVDTLGLKVEVSIDDSKAKLLCEFEDFAKKVMSLDVDNLSHIQDAKVYRVGVTNAADRGLDMYSNWGPAIQIKHLSLDVELAKNIVDSVSSDKVIIVCKDAEKDVIVSLLTQIGWRNHIQSIVTENDLINWYEKALRGQYSELMGKILLSTLCEEIALEFPSVDTIPKSLQDRHYENISDTFWK